MMTCAASKDTNDLIVLLTDFGKKDFYVGAMKGVIYSINHAAKIDEISNDVSKYDIAEGAQTLLQAAKEFPPGTVFLVVIDPGVGTERKPIALRTNNGQYFVAPDNGVCSLVIDAFGLDDIREIANPNVMRKGAQSSTFHGRDIFGPTAAHLARGFPFDQIGPRLNDYVQLEMEEAELRDGFIKGRIEIIDEYGNAITNITKDLIEDAGLNVGDYLTTKIGDSEMTFEFVKAYGNVAAGDYLGLISSSGRFELAINQGNLAQQLRITRNMHVVISR